MNNTDIDKKEGLANLYNDYYFFLRSLYKHLDGTATRNLQFLLKSVSKICQYNSKEKVSVQK